MDRKVLRQFPARRCASRHSAIASLGGKTYAPELNSTEKIWEYLRSNCLSQCVWDTYEAILDACCDAWNALIATPDIIASIGTRGWAQVRI